MKNENVGTLFVVSVPIGNVGDLSHRAVEVLKTVDIIACEDTRVSGRLLKEYGIKNQLMSFFEHNEDFKIDKIVNELIKGKNVALISDSGTPLISDPGFKLVRKIREMGFNITAIPGASSVICALTLSGFPTDKFLFIGFLNAKNTKKEKEIRDALNSKATVICFESPHRILFTVELLVDMKINNEICVCREMTKKFEEVIIGSPKEVLEKLKAKDAIKGEIVMLIKQDKNEDDKIGLEDLKDDIVEKFSQWKTSKDIVDEIVGEYGLPKKEVFKYVNDIKKLVK